MVQSIYRDLELQTVQPSDGCQPKFPGRRRLMLHSRCSLRTQGKGKGSIKDRVRDQGA